jgi:hypothetical protein
MKKIITLLLLLSIAIPAISQVYTSEIPWEIRVALGTVDGVSTVSKFGENPTITTATDPEDVWDFGGLYTYSDTSDINYIASSSVSDTELVIVYGLDSLWRDTSQIVLVQGQTPQKLGFRFRRAYRMINIGDESFVGTITLATSSASWSGGAPTDDTKVRAQIINGNNQTLMTQYTVPASSTGLFTGAIISISGSGVSSQYLSVQLLVRPYGSVFQVKQTVQLVTDGTSTTQFLVFNPLNIPARSDLVVRVKEVSATMGVSASYGLTIVEDGAL